MIFKTFLLASLAALAAFAQEKPRPFATGVVDEPIEFEQQPSDSYWSSTVIHYLWGMPIELSPKVLRGTNIKFQWYKRSGWPSNPPQWTYTPIDGATNQTLYLGLSIGQIFDLHVVATNSISSASQTFTPVSYQPLRPNDGFASWEGLEGERYRFNIDHISERISRWFKDGVPIDPPPIEGVLSPEIEGTYWVTTTNSYIPFEFTSSKMALRIAPIKNMDGKFRRVGPSDGIMNADGSVIYSDGVTFYRWHKGVTEKLFEAPANFRIPARSAYVVGADNKFCDIGLGTTNFTFTEIVRLDTNGLRLITTANRLIGLAHVDGKTAFWESSFSSATALKVFDGTEVREWFNTSDLPPEYSHYKEWHDGDTRQSIGFDGTTVAFVGADGAFTALFTGNAAGEIRCLAKFGDLIPGTTNQFGPFSHQRIVVQNGKVLFTGYTTDNYRDRCLFEYDPAREPKFRIIAKEGDMVGGLAISLFPLTYPLGYTSDGSILFTAALGWYNLELPSTPSHTNDVNTAVVRWRDGNLTAEVTSRQRMGGQQNGYVQLLSVAGTNYCFTAQDSLFTTAEGGPRPSNPTLQTTPTTNGFNATWSGKGVLQWSPDLIRWATILSQPGAVTNDTTKSARFFRVFYP